MATVTVIPAKPMQELKGLKATAKLRVCAYARVSTDNEEQISSYQAQVEHYTSYIQNNTSWEFVEIFSDDGINYSVKIADQNSDVMLGGVAKIESMCGGVLTEKSMGWNLAV